MGRADSDAATALGVAAEQAVVAAKIEQRDVRPPLQSGSYGGWGGHPHHRPEWLRDFVVVPLDEWSRLLDAARDAAKS